MKLELNEHDRNMVAQAITSGTVLCKKRNAVVKSITDDLQTIHLVNDSRPFHLVVATELITYWPEGEMQSDYDCIIIYDDSENDDLSQIVAFYGS